MSASSPKADICIALAHVRFVPESDMGRSSNPDIVFGRVRNALKRNRCRLGKFHRKAAGTQTAPELLAKQLFNIWLVIDNANEKIHACPPDLARDAAMRGRTILNSVNAPGWVSTSIEPPCCLTMMS